jgi:SSS family transporter
LRLKYGCEVLLFSILLYLLLTLLVGFWAARRVKNSGDFMLAGRSLPMVLSTAALFATWFGSETIFGASSEFLKGGLFAVIEDPFGAALCLLLFGMFFARRLYSMNLLTLGDFFRNRFGPKAELLASLLMVPSYFGYTAGQLVALGLILNVITGLPVWQGIIVSSLVVTLYTAVGGMWAISVTDFVQSIVIVVGLLILAGVLATKAGGVMAVMRQVPQDTFRFLPAWNVSEVLTYLAAWSVLGLGSIPSQDVFQRAMSSGSPRIAVQSCYYGAALYLTIAMLPLFISLCIQQLYPEHINGDTQLVLPSMVMMHTSLPVQVLFFGALMSAILSTTSSSILAPAAVFSENIVKPLSATPIPDRRFLFITRLSVLVFAACATVLACIKTNIYELVGNSSVFSLVSLFVPLVLGLYWRRCSKAGAMASMIAGLTTWIWFSWRPISVPALVPSLGAGALAAVAVSLFFPDEKST